MTIESQTDEGIEYRTRGKFAAIAEDTKLTPIERAMRGEVTVAGKVQICLQNGHVFRVMFKL